MKKNRGSLIRKSLQLRLVDCGSCNACESELAQLLTKAYDGQRWGIDMVASPRHADAVIVTGPLTQQMRLALQRTHRAMGEPRRAIALGDCAVSGHVHKGGYSSGFGLEEALPADLQIPGCPPTPEAILKALRAFMAAGGPP